MGPLGAGGFGAVYEAIDTRTGQTVAVKELDDTSADSIARFKHEFRALADCHHENLVSLKELIEQDGRWLIVMELVPGTDFLRYVQRADNDNRGADKPPLYDEARLRSALIGMVEGLRALHRFGVVHRDLKPSNVRVRPDGRAVLLDFGLATSVDPKKQSTHAMGVGTVVYMAPEQAGGQSLSPAVDLYALGVCLFEALTGRAPFEGEHAIKILLEKQRVEAPRASSLAASVPRDLDELCARLLAIEPATRPSLDEVLSVLKRTPVANSLAPIRGSLPDNTFAGRESELAHLERALARTHESELRVVLIEGESGVGKSELVSEFLRRTYARQPKLLTLRGRCYENEQVSYKAFDGCIDELAKVLRRMPEAECTALLPKRATLLGQLFPVLRNVKAIAKAAREGISADPTARRLEAFAALSQLLSKLAEDRPVVLVLDDLQWADSESFRLLTALDQQPTRAPILLLGTLRPRDELEPDVSAHVEELRKWRHTDVISLFGLPREQAIALARNLLGPLAPAAWLETIAEESQGHPLFLSELVQYTASHDFESRGSLTLEAALRARIDRLERPARELLEVVALAARPYPAPVFANALGSSIEEPVRSLLASKLLKQRKGQELGCYHDRIRHAAVELIARTRLRGLHHQLAAALEKLPDADPSEQARHWSLAGQEEHASNAYEQAATKALGALAFARAAAFCARAIELLPTSSDERLQRLTVQRAHSLACAGRSSEAVQSYQVAADAAQGDVRLRLRSQVAKHLMLSAKVDQGIALARELLVEVGFRVPRTAFGLALRCAWDALCISLRGLELPAHAPNQSGRERLAISIYHEISYAVAVAQPLISFSLTLQYVRRAMRLASRQDAALGLATAAWIRTVRSSLAEAAALLTRAQQLMEGESDPLLVARFAFILGTTHAAGLDWASALPHLRRAQKVAQEQCPDDPFLLTSARYQLAGAWYHSGAHAELAREVGGWLAEAGERKDALAVALLTGMGYSFARHLMQDAPDLATQELELARQQVPEAPYGFAHFGLMIGTVVSLLYRGGPAALRYLNDHERTYARAFLLRTNMGKEARHRLRVIALQAAYCVAPVHERAALLKQTREAVAKLRRASSPLMAASCLLALAQIEAMEGRREQALAHARDATNRFRALRHGTRRGAQYLEGVLEGGLRGQEKCEAALAELRAEGWKEPLRQISVAVPLIKVLGAAKLSSVAAPQATLLLDRYEVTGALGHGGFGTVVSARDVESGRTVALKELVRSGGMSLERFKQEFRALADLHHEHIVQLDGLFEHQGTWYIAMELVEGTDLVSYVRASGACDATRLRGAFVGLTEALSALHRKGFVHRDVKPENVLVTAEGRAVLIDFGLIARVGEEAGIAGSLDSAAPEQLQGATPTSASDVYALGSCLYATLTGRLPFAGAAQAELISAKQTMLPRAPVTPGLEDVARLCMLMLAPNPDLRPGLDEVFKVLGQQEPRKREGARSSLLRAEMEESSQEQVFAGREQEAKRLQHAFDSAAELGLTLALVEGESGLGKSALIADFAARNQRRTPALHVLKSRCYENEQVAFKAFDGAVDQLAQLLRGLPRARCDALLPKRAALLAQLFPVLSSVPAIEQTTKKGLPADPAARKQAGLETFIELLENLTAEHNVMFAIDDLQWADGESFALLHALAKRAAQLPVLFVCSTRPATELEPEVASELALLRALPRCETIALDTLESSAAMALAQELLGDELDPERLSALVAESKGHPLFLRELVLHEKAGLGAPTGSLTLDAALRTRVESLSAHARELLSLIALADKPHGAHVYARALTKPEHAREALVELLGQGLARRRADKLSCYHDRIRGVAVALLASEQRAEASRKLATALSRDPQADAAERARLWHEAGDSEQAAVAYEQAGDQALETLAFARAEQHYGRALLLLGDERKDERWQRVLVARGHALVRAGRSADAARAFQRASEHAQGENQVRLRMWAAQHLIQSAQVEEGLRAATALLGELGIALPKSESAAKARIAWERAFVKVRGIKLKQRDSSSSEHLALEALHGLSSPVRAVSFLPGSALVVQYLRRALSAGDPRHAARALAYEALWRSMRSATMSHGALFEQSRTLAEASADFALMAEVDLTRGVALISQNQVKLAPTYLLRAHELLQTHCHGQSWLLTATRMYLGHVWFATHQLHEIQRATGAWVDDARARDDQYAVAALVGFGAASVRHALDDDPEAGLAEIEAAVAPWPREPFATTHLGATLTSAALLSTCQQGPRYLRFLDEEAPRLERAFLMRAPGSRFWLGYRRIQAMLQCMQSPRSGKASELLDRVRAEHRDLARQGQGAAASPAVAFNTLFVEGWLLLLEGKREAAIAPIQRAHALALANEFPWWKCAAYTLGVLEGGEAGRARCEEAKVALQKEGWRDWRRGLALPLPGLLEHLEG